jgi:hypothetical protein
MLPVLHSEFGFVLPFCTFLNTRQEARQNQLQLTSVIFHGAALVQTVPPSFSFRGASMKKMARLIAREPVSRENEILFLRIRLAFIRTLERRLEAWTQLASLRESTDQAATRIPSGRPDSRRARLVSRRRTVAGWVHF